MEIKCIVLHDRTDKNYAVESEVVPEIGNIIIIDDERFKVIDRTYIESTTEYNSCKVIDYRLYLILEKIVKLN